MRRPVRVMAHFCAFHAGGKNAAPTMKTFASTTYSASNDLMLTDVI